jgi:hypothetical protein
VFVVFEGVRRAGFEVGQGVAFAEWGWRAIEMERQVVVRARGCGVASMDWPQAQTTTVGANITIKNVRVHLVEYVQSHPATQVTLDGESTMHFMIPSVFSGANIISRSVRA